MKNMKNFKYTYICTIILIIFTMFACSSCSFKKNGTKKVLDISDYFDVKYNGSDGSAVADIQLNYESLISNMCSSKDYTDNTANAIILKDAITYNVNNNCDLSNNDIITVNVYVSDKIKHLNSNYTLEDTLFNITVCDLASANNLYSYCYELLPGSSDSLDVFEINSSSETSYNLFSDKTISSFKEQSTACINTDLKNVSNYNTLLSVSYTNYSKLNSTDTSFSNGTPELYAKYISCIPENYEEQLIYIYKTTITDSLNKSIDVYIPVSTNSFRMPDDLNFIETTYLTWSTNLKDASPSYETCLAKLKFDFYNFTKIEE